MSKKALVLAHPAYQSRDASGKEVFPPAVGYSVVTVKNSVAYIPGQFLSKDEVSDLCEMTGTWDITVQAHKSR